MLVCGGGGVSAGVLVCGCVSADMWGWGCWYVGVGVLVFGV